MSCFLHYLFWFAKVYLSRWEPEGPQESQESGYSRKGVASSWLQVNLSLVRIDIWTYQIVKFKLKSRCHKCQKIFRCDVSRLMRHVSMLAFCNKTRKHANYLVSRTDAGSLWKNGSKKWRKALFSNHHQHITVNMPDVLLPRIVMKRIFCLFSKPGWMSRHLK